LGLFLIEELFFEKQNRSLMAWGSHVFLVPLLFTFGELLLEQRGE